MNDFFDLPQLPMPGDGYESDASSANVWLDLPEWEVNGQFLVPFIPAVPFVFVDSFTAGGVFAPVFPAPVELDPGVAAPDPNPEILDAGNRLSMGLEAGFDSTSGIILIMGNADDGTALVAGDEALNWDFSAVDLVNITGVSGSKFGDVIMGFQGEDNLFGLGSGDSLDGCGGDDTLSGGCGKDMLSGGEGDDSLKGGRGADVLEGGAGSDELRGQRGDDVLIVDGADDGVISGGRGEDTLVLNDAKVTLNLVAGAGADVQGIEIIDAGGNGANVIVLDTEALLGLSTQTDTLCILGDEDDRVIMVDGDWTLTGQVEVDGLSFNVFENGAAILQLQEGVQNVGLNGKGNGGNGAGQDDGDGEDDPDDGGGEDDPDDGGGEDDPDDGGGEDDPDDGGGEDDPDDGGGEDDPDDGGGEDDPDDEVPDNGIIIPAVLSVSSLDGNNGFQISGEEAWNFSASSVSGAGDINGDGFADVIVSSGRADTNGTHGGGSYIIFGNNDGFPPILEPSSLDGINGFQIIGPQSAYAGSSVSTAGDMNGDGIDDLIIGSDFEYSVGHHFGATYIVFGNTDGFPAEFQLSGLDGTDGFRISGVSDSDFFGYSVSSAGDVNGDGFDDVIIGAVCAATGGYQSGACYVIFGKDSGFASELAVSSLNGGNGFRIDGEDPSDRIGQAVSGLGDVNGDGYDDFIIGSRAAELEEGYSGAAYVVFGSGSEFGSELQLSALNGANGFLVVGSGYKRLGDAVGGAGDVNGDGFDDIIVGAPRADSENGGGSGISYVIFGRANSFAPNMAASSLDGENGFQISGDAGDWAGMAVDGAGDVNADGFDDVIVSGWGVHSHFGGGYVVYGHANGFAANINASDLDGSNGFMITGKVESETLGLSVSAAGDVNDDGFDDIIISSPWSDSGGINSGTAYVIFGGISDSVSVGSLLYEPEGATFVPAGDEPGFDIWT